MSGCTTLPDAHWKRDRRCGLVAVGAHAEFFEANENEIMMNLIYGEVVEIFPEEGIRMGRVRVAAR